jgi:hypothetical protein
MEIDEMIGGDYLRRLFFHKRSCSKFYISADRHAPAVMELVLDLISCNILESKSGVEK